MNTSRQPVLIPRPYPERFASPEPQKLTFLLNVAHCVCPGSMYQLGSNLNVDGFSTCTPRSQSKSIPIADRTRMGVTNFLSTTPSKRQMKQLEDELRAQQKSWKEYLTQNSKVYSRIFSSFLRKTIKILRKEQNGLQFVGKG